MSNFFCLTICYTTIIFFFSVQGFGDCYVRLERNWQAESLVWLNQPNQLTEPSKQRQLTRRTSVASTNLFSVENNIREVGFDFLARIPRSGDVRLDGSTFAGPAIDPGNDYLNEFSDLANVDVDNQIDNVHNFAIGDDAMAVADPLHKEDLT